RVHLITINLHSHFRPPAGVGCRHSDLNSRPEAFSCLVVRHKGKRWSASSWAIGWTRHCYYNSGVLAREQGYKQNEEKKLQRALALFMELKMTLQREAVQATLS
ncbi:MAG TPA: hypothetical protein VF783_06330, partial [Terriglobales bacterium]